MPWIIGAILLALAYLAASLGSLATSGGGGSVPGAPRTCFTKCGFFSEFRCEDGVYIGFCFLFWPCSAGIGAHGCTTGGGGLFPFNLFARTCTSPEV
ncbi:MAG: hypothetical protein E6G97_22750 [Alphaproteobacteria bacterium]|nr:MAG: hypothetical protein E6G97_22750 [Alphaproteobacteria bacterium]